MRESEEEISSHGPVSGPDGRRPGHRGIDGNKGSGTECEGTDETRFRTHRHVGESFKTRDFLQGISNVQNLNFSSLHIPETRKPPSARHRTARLPLNRRRTFRRRLAGTWSPFRGYLSRSARTGLRPVPRHRRVVTPPLRQGVSVATASSPAASRDWLRSPLR